MNRASPTQGGRWLAQTNYRYDALMTHHTTLVSQIVEHTEIDEHLEEIAENLIVEHVIYTISIETNNRTPGIFFHCINSQTRLTIRDTRVPGIGSQLVWPEPFIIWLIRKWSPLGISG